MGEVHIHYGDLKKGQMSILNRVFRPNLKKLSKLNLKVVEYENSLQKNILSSLASSRVVGVIFLGHPAIKTKGVGKGRHIVHGYLKDSAGMYLPKNIFSGARDNLAFISVLTCHEGAIIPLYKKYLPSFIDYFESPSHSLNALENPLFEFTSFYSTPKVIDSILNRYDSSFFDSSQVEKTSQTTISIKLKDLVSSRFSYTVSVNGSLVGIISRKLNSRGRILNKIDYQFKVSNSLFNKGSNFITISADDYLRPRPNGLKVVDDILIEEVSLISGENRNNLAKNIHLGDQEVNPDMNEGLGFLRNKDNFRGHRFVGPRWERSF